MGNLDNLGVIVVVLLLAGIIVVSFVIDPEETDTKTGDEALKVSSGKESSKAGPATKPGSVKEPARRYGSDTRDRNLVSRDNKPNNRIERRVRGGQGGQSGSGRPEGSQLSGQRPNRPASPFTKTLPMMGGQNLNPGPGKAGKPEVAKNPARPRTSVTPKGFPRPVTLKSNESIWDIAVREYGSDLGARMVKKVLSRNSIRDPRSLRAGTIITLPAPDQVTLASARGTSPRATRPSPSRAGGHSLPFAPGPQNYSNQVIRPVAAGAGQRYVVRSGDTLGEIAVRTLGSTRHIRAIMALNGIKDQNKIIVGSTLRIPAKK